VALEVANTTEMTERRVARLDAPAGLQLTLFQELEPLADRAGRTPTASAGGVTGVESAPVAERP
jgi:hypothetical protein